jgi:hypothetical protein
MSRSRGLVPLLGVLVASSTLSGFSCSSGQEHGAEEGARVFTGVVKGARDAGKLRLPPGVANAAAGAFSSGAVKAAKAMFNIPEATLDGGQIQLNTVKGAVQKAACNYLSQWVTNGAQPPDSDFCDPLNQSLHEFGRAAANQADAIENSYDSLKAAVTGTTDATDAAKSIACAFVGLS